MPGLSFPNKTTVLGQPVVYITVFLSTYKVIYHPLFFFLPLALYYHLLEGRNMVVQNLDHLDEGKYSIQMSFMSGLGRNFASTLIIIKPIIKLFKIHLTTSQPEWS